MTVQALLSQVEGIAKTLEAIKGNTEESVKANFDDKIGITAQEHDSVVSLLQQFETAAEELTIFTEALEETEDKLRNLNSDIKDINFEEIDAKINWVNKDIEQDPNVLNGDPSNQDTKFDLDTIADLTGNYNYIVSALENAGQKIDDLTGFYSEENAKNNFSKFSEELEKAKDRLLEYKKHLEDVNSGYRKSRAQAERDKAISRKKLGLKGVDTDEKLQNALNAKKSMVEDLFKSGSISKVLKKLGPYGMIADTIIKGVEFAIDKTTEYAKVRGENMIRTMNATATKDINELQAALDVWQDAVKGTYSAQKLAYESRLEMTKAENANILATTKLTNTWTNWIPIWGQLNKLSEARLELDQKWKEANMQNAMKKISQAQEISKRSDDYLEKQDDAIHKYQIVNGLTKEQTEEVGKFMMDAGPAFAKLGKKIEDAVKMSNSFSERSGRAVNFTQSDYTQSFAVGRLVGEDNLLQFQSMMNIFNSSVSDSAQIMYDMYNDANKMGISQQKLTKSVLSNLKLANKYDFKNGRKGFIELAKWAENARMNLASFGSAIEKVQSGGLEGIIKQGAGLQVLGGNIAMGADPLAMMFESFADQKSYAERIQSMLKGYGNFNRKTGETTFTMNEQMTLRAMAEQLGMPVEELKDMARGSRQKEYVKAQMTNSKLSKENKDAVANKAQYNQKTGKWEVAILGEGKKNVEDLNNEDMAKVLSNNKEENAEKYAQETFSAVDRIKKNTDEINSKLGRDTYDNFLEMTEKSINETRQKFEENLQQLVKLTETNREDAFKELVESLNSLNTILEDYKQALGIAKNNGGGVQGAAHDFMEHELVGFNSGPEAEKAMKKLQEAIKTGDSDEIDKALSDSSVFSHSIYNYLSHNISDWDDLNEKQKRDKGKEMFEVISSKDMMIDQMRMKNYWDTSKNQIQGERTARNYRKTTFGGLGGAAAGATIGGIFGGPVGAVIGGLIGGGLGALGGNEGDKNDMNRVHDGIATSNNSPMEVKATSVTPIHDGVTKVARTDPKDTGVFAKTGGPFDKLFDGIFGKVNEIYNIISSSNQYTSNSSYSRNASNTEYSNAVASILTTLTKSLSTINEKNVSVKNENNSTSNITNNTILNTVKTLNESMESFVKFHEDIVKNIANIRNSRLISNLFDGNVSNNTLTSQRNSVANSYGGNVSSTNYNSRATSGISTVMNHYGDNVSRIDDIVKTVNGGSMVTNRYGGNVSRIDDVEKTVNGGSMVTNRYGGNVSRIDGKELNISNNTNNRSSVNGGSMVTNRYGDIISRIIQSSPIISEIYGGRNMSANNSFIHGNRTTNRYGGNMSRIFGNTFDVHNMSDNRSMAVDAVNSNVTQNNTVAGKQTSTITNILRAMPILSSLTKMFSTTNNVANYGSVLSDDGRRADSRGGVNAVGSDRFGVLYDAYRDKDAHKDRVRSMLRGLGTRDSKTGNMTFNANESIVLKAMSENTGIPVEELKNMAGSSVSSNRNVYNNTRNRNSVTNSSSSLTSRIMNSISSIIGVSDVEANEVSGVGDERYMTVYESPSERKKSTDNLPKSDIRSTGAPVSSSGNINFDTLKVEINGKLNLESNGREIDIMNELRSNPMLMRSISQMLAQHMSSAMNGGRGKHSMNYGSI